MPIIKEDYGKYKMPSFEEFFGDGMVTLYRVAKSKQMDSIFKYGLSREYTGSAGGNMYGPGVYCTLTLSDTIHNVKTKPHYGDCIIMMRLIGGFDRFLIFDRGLAQQIYGSSWHLGDQIIQLTGDKRMARTIENFEYQYNLGSHRTAPAAHEVWLRYEKSLWQKHKIRGLIYKGAADGFCVLPYDFSSIIPVAVSYDQGKTFEKRFTKDLYTRMQKTIDAEFRYKGNGQIKDVITPVNGYCTVINYKNQYNLIDINTDKFIFPVWVDIILGNVDEDGDFHFSYKGLNLTGNVNGTFRAGHKDFPLGALPVMAEGIIKAKENWKKKREMFQEAKNNFDILLERIN